jgi:hypothetical protein
VNGRKALVETERPTYCQHVGRPGGLLGIDQEVVTLNSPPQCERPVLENPIGCGTFGELRVPGAT